MPDAQDQYFATLSGLALAEALFARVKKYYQRLPKTVSWRRYAKALSQYYGLPSADNPFDVVALGVAGEQGELTTARIGQVGSIGRHIITMSSQTKPAWQPIAINTDYASVAQTSFCSGLLDYYFREERIDWAIDDSNEKAIIFGLSYLAITWEPKVGDVYAMDGNGVPVMKADGDPQARAYTPLEVAVDLDRSDTDFQWHIIRRPVNRWDLVARYCPKPPDGTPETPDARALRSAILGKSDDRLPHTGGGTAADREKALADTAFKDMVPLYSFFHAKTPACPEGRWCDFLDGQIHLGSGPLQYERSPVIQVTAGVMVSTAHGDSSLHQLGGLQDLLDQLFSSAATNNINGATNIICVPKDAEWDRNSISGMTILACDRGPNGELVEPKAVNLTKTPAETYKMIEMIVDFMSSTSGVNSVVQGDIPPGDPSGSLMALVHAQAIRFQSGIAKSRERAIADSGNLLLSHLKRFATEPKQAIIAGKAKTFMLETFTKDKLANIDRVQVESANPITKRPEFKVQAADNLLAKGLIETAEEYFEVAETGRVEMMTENPVTEQLNIRKENELLRAGKVPPTPPFTDHPLKHIHEHRSVLDDPLARENPGVVHATLAHIQEHINVWMQTDPQLIQALGLPLPPPLPGPPPGEAPPAPGGPQHGPPPPPPPNGPPAPPGPQGAPPGPPPGPSPGGGSTPAMPQMPKNPSTGQRWNGVDGGAPPGSAPASV